VTKPGDLSSCNDWAPRSASTLPRSSRSPTSSRVGSCFDCAAAEAFFSTLEWEVLSRQHLTDPDHARAVVPVVQPWCYDFYNHRRRHSSAHMMSPIAYENLTADQPAAA
jgi:putative transposase